MILSSEITICRSGDKSQGPSGRSFLKYPSDTKATSTLRNINRDFDCDRQFLFSRSHYKYGGSPNGDKVDILSENFVKTINSVAEIKLLPQTFHYEDVTGRYFIFKLVE